MTTDQPMDFLQLAGQTVLVTGVGNKRSVAYFVARVLEDAGATVVYTVHSADRRDELATILEGREVWVCDLAKDEDLSRLGQRTLESGHRLAGVLHSVAFANYHSYTGVFHEVRREDFLQAIDVSCYSLIALSNALKPALTDDASVVAISISTTQMAAESYGYMAPAKAALDSTLTFLAKSFSHTTHVRFNAVRAGLLKTRASAGIPNYLENYLFAEQATLRKEALTCEEVAHTAAFLLSPRSSGINAQGIVVDGGMGRNYFDSTIVEATTRAAWPTAGE